MPGKHTLGLVLVRAGELISFTYDDSVPNRPKRLTVVALTDIDLSKEMATFCGLTNRSGKDIYTENALPAFIEYMAGKRMLHVSTEVSVHFGTVKRPAARLLNEYRFDINPEFFWEEKLTHRYESQSFSVINHQQQMLTIIFGIEAPFYVLASLIDLKGDSLGVLRLSVLPDGQHTLISDEDLERIRLALQSDIVLHMSEIAVMVERVVLTSNPDFGSNSFKRHLPEIKPLLTENQHSTSKGPVHELSEQ
ncbi:hypothetical protein D9M68_19370 [compost metagenome]